ncbi:hypothetical protein E4U34_007677 [Claviceps purpurea]|nr:hypothetical protein E4U36_001644 [Claviceps purpurea]KAG6230841.1 hypothetical protein E4U34_007677 [Claviceps purpurea]KAG6271576.1 hypothetical protein E4U49_003786 [Claviceps purpurea]
MANNGGFSFDPSRLNKASAAEFSSSESESENEYRIPGVEADDNDFGDFNPRKKRRVGRNNKEQAALGIFGSDSEDDGPHSRWKRKTLRTKGMTFVPTTTSGNNSDENMEDEEDNLPVLGNGDGSEQEVDDDEEEEEEEDGASAGVGLGFGRGLSSAFHKTRNVDADDNQGVATPKVDAKFTGMGVLGMGFVPSSARDPVLRVPDSEQSKVQNKPQPSTFTAKGKMNAKGFGARMMAKMGYVEGKGLGREGQGRNVIIEANLRPQGIGLGAVKEKTEQERKEEKRQAELRGEKIVDSDEDEKKRRRAKKKALGGGGGGGGTPRRPKTKYLTVEELKASAPGLHIPEAFTPILDMTGPGSKLLASASGLMTPTSAVSSDTPEVIEARKLARRAQADLQAFSEEWRSLEERKTWMDLELKEREQEMEDLRADFEKLRGFCDMVTQELSTESDLEQVLACLRKAAEANIASSETGDLAVAAIHPFLKDAEWNLLKEPSKFTTELRGLSATFMKPDNDARTVNKWSQNDGNMDGIYRRHQKATTPYESMMYKIWLPKAVAAVREWDPLEPGPMLDVIENWNDLLPQFVGAQVMDHVARKLEAAVSDWNPKKKRQSHHLPHSWLFPWLQYLPAYHLDPKGTGLVAEVKRKFRHLIGVWEFERGPVPGLKQWQEILGSQWGPLIMSHVLPSMGRYLRSNFRVDPADQEPYLPVLTGVMKWNQLLSDSVMAEVLVQNVFPMWYEKLQQWLALAEADLEEVAEWYTWWRGVLLKDMAGIEGVKMELDKGLQMMNLV